MKSWIVHYRNKYPGGRVDVSESALNVFNSDGQHCVSLRKDGAGGLVCVSKEMGCLHEHDLSPIPKDARLWKMDKVSGAIVRDEKHKERSALVEKFMDEEGRVVSCEALMLADPKIKFDESQRLKQD